MNTHGLASIELIIFDVDGVLTDGSINIHDDGSETKRFNVRDGYGFSQALRSISKSESSPAESAKPSSIGSTHSRSMSNS